MNTRTLDILKQLIGFDTTSSQSNLALIHYVQQMLDAHGIDAILIHDESGKKANLFASVGPKDVPGVLLSGHTDVVPVAGQAWTKAPFQATVSDGRLYGRGACDMKGFIAVAIDALLSAVGLPLQRPLQLALSYDEEIGCVGVRRLLDVLHLAPQRPFLCIVGEPTNMHFALGHKGKASYRVHCLGQEAHSSLAPTAANAIHLACDFIGGLRSTQQRLQAQGTRDDAYDIAYSTVHVGRIDGGKALNIVPNLCTLEFEIRHLPADDPEVMLTQLAGQAEAIVREAKKVSGVADIHIESLNAYPGLDTSPTVEAVRWLKAFAAPETAQVKVAFGTEGGLFAQRLNVPVVVCGPGSINQAHKPDEYVELVQLQACERLLQTLVRAL